MVEWVSASCQLECGSILGVEYIQHLPGGLYAPLHSLDSSHLAS
jgi:hypothetical protein